jgi:hypothetical protein
MNSIATVQPLVRGRLALIAAGALALLGWFTTPAQAGYYGDPYYTPDRCSYRCGYPAYPYYPVYHRHYGCYSCGRHLIYERRYIEREYVERRYGYGYHRHYGCYSYGYRCHYGYNPYGPDRSWARPWGYGYGGIGRRWPAPYLAAYGDGYEEPPRPPAPIYDGDE